jgi:hypothetical protein
MCLLKKDEQDTNCGHEECKNYYMLNKQICMYNLASSQNPLNQSIPLLGSQSQKNPLISQTTVLSSHPSQYIPSKKNRNQPLQNNILEQEVMGSQKKKIKTEGIEIWQ